MAGIQKIDGEAVRRRILQEGTGILLTRGEVVALGALYPTESMRDAPDARKYLGNMVDAAIRRGRSSGQVRKDSLLVDNEKRAVAADALTWLRRALKQRLEDLPAGSPVRFERKVVDSSAKFTTTVRRLSIPGTLEECREQIKRMDDRIYELETENTRLQKEVEKLRRRPTPRNALGQFKERV